MKPPPIFSGPQQGRTAIIAVPIDDENLIQWYIFCNPEKPVDSWRNVQRANQWPMAGGLPGICSAEQAIVRVRRQLLEEVHAFIDGKPPKSGQSDSMSYKDIRAVSGRLASASEDWRQISR